MGTELKALADKVLDRLKSSRVWATLGGNVLGLEYVQGEWPRAIVIIAVNLGYVASETALYWKGLKKK